MRLCVRAKDSNVNFCYKIIALVSKTNETFLQRDEINRDHLILSRSWLITAEISQIRAYSRAGLDLNNKNIQF